MRTFIMCALRSEFTPLPEWEDITFYSGVGKVKAAICATNLCRQLGPGGRIINIGTAGGCSFAVGDLIECGAFFQRDVEAIYNMNSTIRLRPGAVCGTGDTFETRIRNDCDVVDMEAYAIARACVTFGVRFHCFKYISDIVGSNSLDKWEEHAGDGQSLFEAKLKELL